MCHLHSIEKRVELFDGGDNQCHTDSTSAELSATYWIDEESLRGNSVSSSVGSGSDFRSAPRKEGPGKYVGMLTY
jgi:hypothetical protein